MSRVVLIEGPLFSVDVVRDLLAGTGVTVEEATRPWSGRDVVGLLVWQAMTDADFARLPSLHTVVTASVGVDHIDLEAAKRRQVWVCHVPDYCVDEMADTTIAMLLALVRGTVALDRSVRDGHWDDHLAGPLGRLSETRLGVIGFGRIGRAVALRAQALDIETWATDPLLTDDEIASAGVRAARLTDLLKGCTAISLHLPLTQQTERLIGAKEIAVMPRGSYLINTARGALVDIASLIQGLDSGHLAGAALDVLPVEPPSQSHPAPRHPRLIVTPHAGWYSRQSEREVVRRASLAMRATLEGRRPQGVVLSGKELLD
jgi:D-3-phosphoglycerate dehydrogenase / 2-oxoglutarate reductase